MSRRERESLSRYIEGLIEQEREGIIEQEREGRSEKAKKAFLKKLCVCVSHKSCCENLQQQKGWNFYGGGLADC